MLHRRTAVVFLLFAGWSAAVVVACSSSTPAMIDITALPDSGANADDASPPPASRCPMPTTIGEPLTCDWLQSASNCWVAALQVVATCPVALGTISADGSTCADTHAGPTATFSSPLRNPVPAALLVDYQVKGNDGGASCYSASFHTAPAAPESAPGDITITTPAGCVSLTATSTAMTITCPDGASHTGRVADLAVCRWPLYAPNDGMGGVSLGLYWGANAIGKSAGQTVDALSCSF